MYVGGIEQAGDCCVCWDVLLSGGAFVESAENYWDGQHLNPSHEYNLCGRLSDLLSEHRRIHHDDKLSQILLEML